MRSNPPFAVAAVCKSHASRAPCGRQFLVFAWYARRVRFASRRRGKWWICGVPGIAAFVGLMAL
eukprot:3314633-Lingulodinium_polyedra.AAC.1